MIVSFVLFSSHDRDGERVIVLQNAVQGSQDGLNCQCTVEIQYKGRKLPKHATENSNSDTNGTMQIVY